MQPIDDSNNNLSPEQTVAGEDRPASVPLDHAVQVAICRPTLITVTAARRLSGQSDTMSTVLSSSTSEYAIGISSRQQRVASANNTTEHEANAASSIGLPVGICLPQSSDTSQAAENINTEATLRRLITASNQFIAESQNISRQNFDLASDSYQEIWSKFMTVFRQCMMACATYVQSLPAAGAIPIHDRCVLLSRSFLPIATAVLSSSSFLAFWGYKTRSIFVEKFPEFREFVKGIDEIGSTLATWQPSTAELALLSALLFFQDTYLEVLVHPQLVANLNHRIKTVLHVTLKQQTSYDLKLRHFMHVFDLLRCSNEAFIAATKEASTNRRDLAFDDVFLEMFVSRVETDYWQDSKLFAILDDKKANCD